jgi:hypothetical protein
VACKVIEIVKLTEPLLSYHYHILIERRCIYPQLWPNFKAPATKDNKFEELSYVHHVRLLVAMPTILTVLFTLSHLAQRFGQGVNVLH